MILGSHNSWSCSPVKKWWMWWIKFSARCQSVTIYHQYLRYGVRCFDLRIRMDEHAYPVVCHGIVEYGITWQELKEELEWLNSKRDVLIRVIHETRTKKQHTERAIEAFREFCRWAVKTFPDILFWCGLNLYDWKEDYEFGFYPTCDEKYASVCSPKIIDDWWPWWFAKFNNKQILKDGSKADVLLIDFVNIR